MGYAKTRAKYGYPAAMSDQDVVLSTRKRPEFGHVTDEDFAHGIDQFEGTASESAPTPALPATPAGVYNSAVPNPTMNPAVAGINAASTIAENGGLPWVARTPERAIKGAVDTIRGLGPLAAGAIQAASLPGRIAGEAGLNLVTGRTQNDALDEAKQGGRAFSRALPNVLHGIVQHTGEELNNPVGEFLKDPTQTSLDALALADLPSLGLRGTADVASRAGGRLGIQLGGKAFAKGARGIAKASMRAAEESTVPAILARANAGAEASVPAYGAWQNARRETMATRKLLAAETKVGATQAEQASGEIGKAFSGLRPSERETLTPVAMGLADIAKNPTRKATLMERLRGKPPEVAANKVGMERALDWYKNKAAANAQESIAAGELTPRTAELRRFQSLRVATGGPEQLKYEGAPRKEFNVSGLEKRAKAATKLAAQARPKGILAAVKESEAARLGQSLKQSNAETAALVSAERKAARYAGRSEQAQKGLKPLEGIDARVAALKDELSSARGEFSQRQEAGRIAVGQARTLGRAEGISAQAQKHLAELDEIDSALSEYRQRVANEALPQRLPWQHSEPSSRLDPRRVAAENVGRLEEKRRVVLDNLRAVAKAEAKIESVGSPVGPRGGVNRIVRLVDQIAREEERRGAIVKGATATTKAEIGLEGARNSALASKAAITGRPVTLARNLGKTEAQLSEANRWQKVAKTADERALRMTSEANSKRGRIPALERLERQTDAVKWMNPNADPAYVPMLPKRGEVLKEMFLKTFRKTIAPQVPGHLKHSAGARFAEGSFENDLGKITARHEQARIAFATRARQLQGVVSQPFARPVKSLKDVDWTKESLIAPEAFINSTGNGLAATSKTIQQAMASGNPQAHLAQAAAQAVASKVPSAAPAGALYAVPKHVAKELAGQLSSEGPNSPLMQILFDRPNDYLRWSALTLRPGFYVNNLVGNIALGTLSGMTPDALRRAVRDRDLMPDAVRGSGLSAVEAPGTSMTLGKLGKITRLPNVMNEGIDNLVRHAAFKSEVDRLAMSKSIKDTGERLAKNMSDAQKAALIGPEGQKAALDHLNRFMNDYTIQSPLQRRVLRKVLPFQSFLVHMGKLAATLPFANPMRARVLSRLAELGNEYQSEQYRESGINPEDVAGYRKNQLPVRKGADGKVITLSSGGWNPASGLGADNTDMQDAPGIASVLNMAAQNSGPVPQEILALLRGTNGLGLPYKKPGITHPFGSNEYYDAQGNAVSPPTPSLIDMVRSNTPAIGLAERLAQPHETYDLTGSPWPLSTDYLPDRKIGGKVVPRRYGFKEALSGYLGVPMRDFTRDELVKKGKKKAVNAQ